MSTLNLCFEQKFEKLSVFQVLEVSFSIYLTRRVFVMHQSFAFCFAYVSIATDKRGYPHKIFLISRRKHMLWVLIRSASMRRF